MASYTEETRPCPACGKRMIQRASDLVLTSYPPQYPWDWWCGCGHTERGGVTVGQTREQVDRARWEAVNG